MTIVMKDTTNNDMSKHYRLVKLQLTLKKRYDEVTNDAGVMWTKDSNRYLLGSPTKRGRKSEEEKAERDRTDYHKFYNFKRSIKKALVEMELFLHVSPKKEIDDVFHKKTIEPFIQAMTTPRMWEIPNPNDPTKKITTHISEGTSEAQRELIGMLARVTLTKFKNIHPNLGNADRQALDNAISTIRSKIEPNPWENTRLCAGKYENEHLLAKVDQELAKEKKRSKRKESTQDV